MSRYNVADGMGTGVSGMCAENDFRSDGGPVRSFVAVAPPNDVLDRMASFVARLRSLAPYKWVGRAQLHLTLRFLGEAPASRVERIADALEGSGAGAFDIRLNRAGGFPNLTRPRVLWLGADLGAKELAALAERVEHIAVETGFPPEPKRFSPHLTLARLRNAETPAGALSRALADAPSFSWRCERLFLVQSRLTSTGPIYTTLREYPMR
ncbi:MAG: RNA 2',3'-cyclic phosphodiesterase [Synergistaceae bacterium]|nr:RNA 2',3'-cyclic phosphodiesterase [Synergistaceae bacterium]